MAARHFNGTSDAVVLGQHASLNLPDGDWTKVIAVKVDPVNFDRYSSVAAPTARLWANRINYTGNNRDDLRLATGTTSNSGAFRWEINTTPISAQVEYESGSHGIDESWQVIAIEFDKASSRIRFWFNGYPDVWQSISDPQGYTNSGGCTIMCRANASTGDLEVHCAGDVAYLAQWNRKLSTTEHTQLARFTHTPAQVSTSDLAWSLVLGEMVAFEHGGGSTIDVVGTTVVDGPDPDALDFTGADPVVVMPERPIDPARATETWRLNFEPGESWTGDPYVSLRNLAAKLHPVASFPGAVDGDFSARVVGAYRVSSGEVRVQIAHEFDSLVDMSAHPHVILRFFIPRFAHDRIRNVVVVLIDSGDNEVTRTMWDTNVSVGANGWFEVPRSFHDAADPFDLSEVKAVAIRINAYDADQDPAGSWNAPDLQREFNDYTWLILESIACYAIADTPPRLYCRCDDNGAAVGAGADDFANPQQVVDDIDARSTSIPFTFGVLFADDKFSDKSASARFWSTADVIALAQGDKHKILNHLDTIGGAGGWQFNSEQDGYSTFEFVHGDIASARDYALGLDPALRKHIADVIVPGGFIGREDHRYLRHAGGEGVVRMLWYTSDQPTRRYWSPASRRVITLLGSELINSSNTTQADVEGWFTRAKNERMDFSVFVHPNTCKRTIQGSGDPGDDASFEHFLDVIEAEVGAENIVIGTMETLGFDPFELPDVAGGGRSRNAMLGVLR